MDRSIILLAYRNIRGDTLSKRGGDVKTQNKDTGEHLRAVVDNKLVIINIGSINL